MDKVVKINNKDIDSLKDEINKKIESLTNIFQFNVDNMKQQIFDYIDSNNNMDFNTLSDDTSKIVMYMGNKFINDMAISSHKIIGEIQFFMNEKDKSAINNQIYHIYEVINEDYNKKIAVLKGDYNKMIKFTCSYLLNEYEYFSVSHKLSHSNKMVIDLVLRNKKDKTLFKKFIISEDPLSIYE